MSFSSPSFTAIAFFVALTLGQGHAELIVLRAPLISDGPRNLTCIAKDDDSALIWNYNLKKYPPSNGRTNFTDFHPAKPNSKNLTCAIWNATFCMGEWKNMGGWKLVNSANRPMAPVYDFRWEEFKEFPIANTVAKEEYQFVRKVNVSSGTAVFSALGPEEVYVYLSHYTNLSNELPKLWITLNGDKGNSSRIILCESASVNSSNKGLRCQGLGTVEHNETGVIDSHEWRTFILKWDANQTAIEVFKDNDHKPFLNATVPKWRSRPCISVGSTTMSSRIRFHFYKYLLTEQKNLEIRTAKFRPPDKNLCFKMLVALCPDCELNITLLDMEGNGIKTWNIYGGENAVRNNLLIWRSVELSMDLKTENPEPVRLVIKTISNDEDEEEEGGGRGQWAIDNFRICKQDEMRESTALIPANLTLIRCQKLSYNKTTLVNPFSTDELQNTSQLQTILHGGKEPCGSTCRIFGKGWFICDRTGCTCDRGFQEATCSRECYVGYGYNCKGSCATCNRMSCNKITGYCESGCKSATSLLPRCETEFASQEPTVFNITNTTARVLHELEIEEDVKATVTFHLTESSRVIAEVTGRTTGTPQTYEAYFEELKPDTMYTVHTNVSLTLGESYENITVKSQGIPSSQISFRTTKMGNPRFVISPEKTKITVKMASSDSGEGYYDIAVYDAANKTSKCVNKTSKFPYVCKNLEPRTEYNVKILQAYTLIFSTTVRTRELVPSKPVILESINQGRGIVKLKWAHPERSPSNIKEFRIHVDYLGTRLRPIPATQIPSEIRYPVKYEKGNYTMKLHLWTSSVYNISIVAVSVYNSIGMHSQKVISVIPGVAFADEEELQVERSGASIKIKTPEVVNATQNTIVRIVVKEIESRAENLQRRRSSSSGNMGEWKAEEYKEDENKPEYLTIESGSNREVEVVATAEDMFTNFSVSLRSPPINLMDYSPDLTWLIILPIIAVVMITFVGYRKRIKLREMSQDVIPLSSMMTNTENSTAPHEQEISMPLPDATVARISIRQPAPDVLSQNSYSYCVDVGEFEEHVKEAMASGLLDQEFRMLSAGPRKKCKYGKLPANLSKNRYKNIIPYDDTRVILRKINGDPHSDYINASYIERYPKKRAYIATQGPKSNTLNDFWRMIWQDKVRVICMLTNTEEDGKSSCEQYWPEVGTGNEYGDILVSNIEHEVFADYTIRTFNLNYQNDGREVTHLHYTGWPDHGVPMYTQSLVAYLKKLLATPSGTGPVVVHCSSGVGRTGTIILCDICLRQGVREKRFDLPSAVTKIRECRENMIENIQQYFLAHLAIVESMISEQTEIPCDCSLPKKIIKLLEQLPSDMKRLEDAVWQDRALHSLAVIRHSVFNEISKNGIQDFVPATPIVPELQRFSTFDSESNYINAVSVDGVKTKKQYLESHLPSSLTFSEYWRLIAEKKIELILILQRPDPADDPANCCEIMFDTSNFIPVPYIEVESKTNIKEEEHFTTQRLLLTDTSEGTAREQPITVLTCTGWGYGKNGKPPAPSALVSLWMASEKIYRKETPTLVLCRDGITGCGLYLALSFLLERMAVERKCDVISAVRAVRRSRTEFVQTLEQFQYLYHAAVNYFECFQTYANFS